MLRSLCLCLLAAVAAQAQPTPEPLVVHRLTAPIVFDGRTDDAAWQAIAPLPITVYGPTYGQEPTEPTYFRLAYDDDYLYLAADLRDSDPANIRVNSLYRDRYSGDDGIALVLDTFNDNENALWFVTMAGGTRMDRAVANDAVFGAGGFEGTVNTNWNTFWDAETRITETGWQTEMRIPFSSLGFQDDNGRVEMGVIVYRVIARKNERHTFPDISPEYDMAFAKPSLAFPIVLDGVQARKPVYVTPYVLGGYGEQALLTTDESAYFTDGDGTREIGLDVKYNVTSNLTLDLTLNTDFAQVEADEQQVNLTRFNLFFPEKRQFFQERASIFEFATGRRDRLFYSRRIGLTADGLPVRILGGAKLVGRVGTWDLGAINMQTAAQDGLASENFGVLRARRKVLNPYSYAGGILTTRTDFDGSYNLAYGLDSDVRLFGDDYLKLSLAQTLDSDQIDAETFDFWQSSLIRAQWQRRRQLGLSYQGTVKWYGSDFLPEMGFISRADILALAGDANYGVLAADASALRQWGPSLSFVRTRRNADGSVQTFNLANRWDAEFKTGSRLNAGVEYAYESLIAPLRLPDGVEVPTGSYRFVSGEASFDMPRTALFRTGIGVGGGGFFDGWAVNASIRPTWTVSRYLEVGGDYSLNYADFPDRDTGFTAHIVRLRVQAALNRRFSLATLAQYSSDGDFATANARLRYNFREGQDLWVVYDEGYNVDRYAYSPVRPTSARRTLLVKYTHTFIW